MNAELGTRNAEWLRGLGAAALFVALIGAIVVSLPAEKAMAAPDASAPAVEKAPPAKTAPAAGGYKPWTPPQKEQVSAPLFVVLAYSAIWLAVLVFVISVWTRQRRVERELAELIREEEEA